MFEDLFVDKLATAHTYDGSRATIKVATVDLNGDEKAEIIAILGHVVGAEVRAVQSESQRVKVKKRNW